MTTYYGQQAYNSQTAQLLDAHYQKPDSRMIRLAMGNACQRVPYQLFSQFTPRHMRIYAQKDPRPDWLKDERYGTVNERCIRPINFSKFGAILVQCIRMGRGLTIFMFIIAIVDKILSAIFRGSLIEQFNDMLIDYLTVGIPLFIWLGSMLIYTLFPVKHGLGSPWEINRQTGLVSQFIYDKRNKKAPPQIRSAPFVEMDAFVLPVIGRFGFTYLFYLHHRYSDLSIRIGDFLGAVTDMNRYEELWDFVQNYMDISQPLPDITLLEEFRSKDPTTLIHDQQTRRNPHYWLAMDDKQWQYQLKHNPLVPYYPEITDEP